MSAKWLQVKNEANQPAEIIISGYIGESMWDDSGTSAKDFRNALNSIPRGRAVTLKINSEGGVIKDGLEMYDAIRSRREDITAEIVGYACSTASWFFLAANKVVTAPNALWMMHESSSMTFGNKAEHARSVAMLAQHDESIAGMIAQHTGKTTTEVLNAMAKETWLTGTEAKEYGLATDLMAAPENAASVAVNAAPLQREHVKNTLAAAAKEGTQTKANEPSDATLAPVSATTPPVTANAAIISQGTEAAGGDGTAAAIKPTKEGADNTAPVKEENTMIENVTPAAATPPAVPADNAALLERLNAAELEINALKAQPLNRTPVSAVVVGDAHDKLSEMPQGDARKRFIVNAWNDLDKVMRAKTGSDEKGTFKSFNGEIVNSNTISSTLTTALLSSQSYTVLQNKLAALQAIFMQVEIDHMKPKAKVEVPKTTAGPTAQTNPTDWESGNATVTNTEITTAEIAASCQLSSADLQNGSRMEWLTYITAVNFSNAVIDALMVPITVANYGAAVQTVAAAAFTPSDLIPVLAAAKDFSSKRLVLDGAYTARLTPTSTLGLNWASGNGGYGFEKILEHNRWSAADANVIGFANDPLGLVGAWGLPINPPGSNSAFNSIDSSTIPGINLPVQVATWVKPGTRVLWMAYDAIVGFAAGDANGVKLIKSA